MSRTIVALFVDVDLLDTLNLRGMPGVSDVVRISSPYKLVSREHHRERSVIRVAGVPIGPDTLTVIAGPCAVETAEQTMAAALMPRAAGASGLRGGWYKPRSSPYAFQGLGEAGLKILAEVREATGLPVVTEVVDPGDVDLVACDADMLQVGTRNMQNFPLLQAVRGGGRSVRRTPGDPATWCCRCPGPRSRSARTASSWTCTRTRNPRCATARRHWSSPICASWPQW